MDRVKDRVNCFKVYICQVPATRGGEGLLLEVRDLEIDLPGDYCYALVRGAYENAPGFSQPLPAGKYATPLSKEVMDGGR